MIKAILFDLDDTIVAWDVVSDESWKQVCHQFATQVEGLQADKLYTAIRETGGWYWSDPVRHRQGRVNLCAARREVVSIAVASLGINDRSLANEIADSYGIEREKAAFLFPKVIDVLHHFRNCGLKLALVTNGSSDIQRGKIERFGLAPCFDSILIEGEFGIGKPDERFFCRALEQVNVTAPEACMIGDDLERDIGGAQKLGIFGIWVDWRGGGLPKPTHIQPDGIIKTPSELLQGTYSNFILR